MIPNTPAALIMLFKFTGWELIHFRHSSSVWLFSMGYPILLADKRMLKPSISIAVNLHRVIHFKIVDIASYHCNNKSQLYFAFKKHRATTWTSINKNSSDNMCTSNKVQALYIHFNTLSATEKPKLFPCSMDLLLCNKIMFCDHK